MRYDMDGDDWYVKCCIGFCVGGNNIINILEIFFVNEEFIFFWVGNLKIVFILGELKLC